jgi:hypothetical protein
LIESQLTKQSDDEKHYCSLEPLRDLRKKYRRQFKAESIKSDQYHLLSVDQLHGILKIPLGDALKIYEMEQHSAWIEGRQAPEVTQQNAVQIQSSP